MLCNNSSLLIALQFIGLNYCSPTTQLKYQQQVVSTTGAIHKFVFIFVQRAGEKATMLMKGPSFVVTRVYKHKFSLKCIYHVMNYIILRYFEFFESPDSFLIYSCLCVISLFTFYTNFQQSGPTTFIPIVWENKFETMFAKHVFT